MADEADVFPHRKLGQDIDNSDFTWNCEVQREEAAHV